MTDSTTRRPRRRWLLPLIVVGVLAVGLLAVAGAIFFPKVLAAPSQPLPYQHSKHVAAGIQCVYCHPGATSGATAGLPSLNKCMGCHASVAPKDPKDQADINKLLKQWESKEPVQWVKIFEQPDFVHFNHRPHIAAGVACESCHGDVAKTDNPYPYNLNMGFCLNCHRQQAPEKVAKLISCETCHY
jgi:hypothetical protein